MQKNKHQTKSHEEVKGIEDILKKRGELVLQKAKPKNGTSKAPLPFSTDTFIQAAGNQGISPKAAMAGAQKLYQSGLITYMRTDSTRINPSFKSSIISNIKTAFGESYLSAESLKSSKSGPKIQDAHDIKQENNTNYEIMRFWEKAFSESGLVKYIIRNILSK